MKKKTFRATIVLATLSVLSIFSFESAHAHRANDLVSSSGCPLTPDGQNFVWTSSKTSDYGCYEEYKDSKLIGYTCECSTNACWNCPCMQPFGLNKQPTGELYCDN